MAARPGRTVRPLRALALAGGGAALLLAGLVLETSPLVAQSAPPGGAEVKLGRKAFGRFRAAVVGSGGGRDLVLTDRELQAVAVMAGRGLGLKRSAITLSAQTVTAAASIDLPAGLWLNLSATAYPAGQGFPPLRLAAGDLVVSGGPARLVAEAARLLLRLRGVDVQPLDAMVRGLVLDDVYLRLRPGVGLGQTGLINDVLALGGGAVDEARVANLLCRLAERQRRAPSDDLAVQVQRMIAFTRAPGPAVAVAEHRNGLVALALFAAGRDARRLVVDDAMLDRCAPGGPPLLLAGRPDLAKHWAVSAALAAVGGREASRLMGEWKELADSMAGGSGFSFADLAADRAGLKLGSAAVDPGQAPALRRELAGISNARLLPPAALGLAEGLSNERFVARYRDTDSARFAAAIRAVDGLLARAGTPGEPLPVE